MYYALFSLFLGSTCSLVEGKFQRNILCMDPRQSTSRVRGVRTKVNFEMCFFWRLLAFLISFPINATS